MYKRKVRILILDAGNLYRGQMAEGYMRHFGSDVVDVISAGQEVIAASPKVIEAMADDGVDVSSQALTCVDEKMIDWADLIVTVCEQADKKCPTIPEGKQKKYWPLSDPTKANWIDEDSTIAINCLRDEIKSLVCGLLGGIRMIAK